MEENTMKWNVLKEMEECRVASDEPRAAVAERRVLMEECQTTIDEYLMYSKQEK
jgi:hypothetical protein